ncbi:MAG: S8 family peptidase [Massilia sp.]
MNPALASLLFAALVALPAGAGARQPQEPPASASEASEAQWLLVMLPMAPAHFRAGAAYDGSYPGDSNRPARRRIAEQIAREHGLRIVDDWPMPVIGIDCFVMEPAPDAAAGQVLAALAGDPRVAWAQPLNLFHGLDAGDPLYPVQPDGKYWHLAQLHRMSTGRGVRVAVVDSGIDAAHPDLAGQVELQENFVDAGPAPAEPHGTAVAGVLAARAGNGVGIAGVAPGAKLMALRACWQAPRQGARCSSFTLGKALNFAILHTARIINLSLAGPSDRLLQALLEAAVQRGATVVSAVDPAQPGGGFPASSPLVLAVSAGAARTAPPRSDALLAPGADIPTCLPGAHWGFVSGSSYAAAHVSGLVALLAQLQPQATPGQLRQDIMTVRAAAMNGQGTNRAAAGSIDACATIERAAGACVCSCISTVGLKTGSR